MSTEDRLRDMIRMKGKTVKTPVFRFECPNDRALVYEGPVGFDMEDQFDCPECGLSEEAWMFPHTIVGTNLWTIGGHYSNDPLVELDYKDVIGFFIWPKFPKDMVHGAGEDILGTFEECVNSLRKQGIIPAEGRKRTK